MSRSGTEACGRVALVGAGPGGVDLITVRGARLLGEADVVVYDALVDGEVLSLAAPDAELMSVGKRKGCGVSQETINAILVDQARRGKVVVRLKGGDPFVFGRGAEELLALQAAGIACEVVPGVSSALAAPALAGIPVTHRGVAASFTVLTGHRIDDVDHDWEAIARSASTLVVLMAASNASSIARRLLAAGRPPTEPVAVVHAAGRHEERTARTTIADLAHSGSPLPSPTVIVIGEVAALDLGTAREFQVSSPTNHAALRR